MAITLTQSAAEEIKRIMEAQNLEAGAVLRMGISGGGCQGLQYALGFDTGYDVAHDSVYEQHGVKLVTNKKMSLHLDGTTIDFTEDFRGRGFSIENPMYPSGGGCPGCCGH